MFNTVQAAPPDLLESGLSHSPIGNQGKQVSMSRWFFVAVVLVAVGTAAVPAAQSQDVTIEAHTERGCPNPASCVFAATGAIADFGTVTTDFVRSTALPSPTVGTAQYVKTFHG